LRHGLALGFSIAYVNSAETVEIRALSFITDLRESRDRNRGSKADAWGARLARLKGRVWGDGIERIATQTVLDFLEVPQRMRSAQTCRRVAALMAELGWKPIRQRGIGRNGYRDQVRGWARDQVNDRTY
jgi:hypothetical protein